MNWLITLLQAIIDALQPPMTPPTIEPVEPDYTGRMCVAIQEQEGWFLGSHSWRNNNPGNCRYSSVGYLPKYGVVKKDADNFAIFSSPTIGMLYLRNLIKEKAKAHPDWSLFTFFAGKLQKDGTRIGGYAPSSDNNDPAHYSSVVAKKMGINQFTFTLRELL